jgi:hypothetical protein
MNNTGRGNPSRDEVMHTPPVEAPALAASPERFIPSHSYRLLKCAKGMDIGGYTVIRVVSADYGFQPAPLPRNGLMHTSSHFESDLPNFTRQSGTHRTAHQHKLPVPRASAAVRKPEEVKGRRRARNPSPLTPLPGKSPEGDQAGFLGVQLKVEARESFAQITHEPLRVGMMLESHKKVISVAHDDNITVGVPASPLLDPQVERIMQTNVGQQRGYRRPLRGANFSRQSLSLFHHSGSQPLLDEPQYPTVRNAVLDEFN